MSDGSKVAEVQPDAQFKRISIPLVRRIYPQLIANNLVSIQPLLGSATLVHYLNNFSHSSINNDEWVKPKKKKIWRDIDDVWEPSQNA